MRFPLTTACALLICASTASAATLRVGPTRTLKAPSAAAAVANDGDLILIDAGTYRGDVATWRANRLTIRGVGGRADLRAAGQHAQGKAIWVVAGNKTTIEHVGFHDAVVPDGNGAGIRQEGAGLTLRHTLFTGNQDGILTGENPASDILIEYSVFQDNGASDGFTHNIYIGHVRSFTLRFSTIRRARVGHEIKSRAQRNDIRYNVIDDGSAPTSYSIDLPNGGYARVVGNLIIQGRNSPNTTVVSYGLEGLTWPTNRMWLSHNTFLNRIPGRGVIVNAPTGAAVALLNNAIAGDGTLTSGAARYTLRANRRVPLTRFKPFAGSPLVNRAIVVAPALTPRFIPAGARRVVRRKLGTRHDIGAFERLP